MLSNHLKIVIRSLVKSPVYFILNLIGLALGIAACFILMHYAFFESQYDAYHHDVANLYRLNVKDEGGVGARTPAPVRGLVESEFSQVQSAVAIRPAQGVLKYADGNGKTISDEEIHMVSASEDFFKVFHVPLLAGGEADLKNRGSLYITASLARKYFGSLDVLGKHMTLFERNFGRLDMVVAGVMADPRPDTHLPVQVMFPMSDVMTGSPGWATENNWGWGEFMTYIKLQPGTYISQEESNAFIDRHIGAENRQRAGIEVQLQPVFDIHISSGIMYEYTTTRDKRILYFLQAVGIMILLLACLNYINLVAARGLQRAKEVGVRKNVGATRANLILQFAMESVITISLAVIVAITLIQLLKPVLADGIGGAFEGQLLASGSSWVVILVLILIALVWSAFQPAIMMSSFGMVDILKGKITNFGKGKAYRKVSVVVQFAASLLLMILSYVIYAQIQHIQNQDLGINIDQKLVVHRPKEDVDGYEMRAQTFMAELAKLSAISTVAATGSVPGEGYNWSTNNMKRLDRGERPPGEYGINVTYIDNNFVQTYQPEVLFGKVTVNDSDFHNTRKKAIINRSAIVPLEISTLKEAVGIWLVNDADTLEVIGVIEDYQHQPMRAQHQPAIYIFDINPQHFTIAYNTGSEPGQVTSNLLDDVSHAYSQVFEGAHFNYSFVDQRFAAAYSYETFLSKVIAVFTLLAIVLSILGLLGLSYFNLERKTKEVGIRKVLGASPISLIWTNTRPFVALVGVAVITALPVAYYISRAWLADYALKVELSIIYFMLPALALFVLMGITVMYHVVRLSAANPVDSLRYE